ncbi:MAG: hypothetical protein P1V20_09930 [Verrucomicrobiales bacterium]|nr:hypothetical protein [Verrucomicrobiales bacterium]
MKLIECFCYVFACMSGLLLFALPLKWAIFIVGIVFVMFPFYAVYVGTTAKPGGEADEENPHQQIFRVIQKCIFIFLPSLGIGALLFGSGN